VCFCFEEKNNFLENLEFLSTCSQKMQVARSVFKLDKPKKSVRWGGFVRLIDPGHKLLDPFLFLVHHVHSFSPGEITGFPAHPHRLKMLFSKDL